MKSREIAERLRELLSVIEVAERTEPVSETDAAVSEGFRDGCDAYSAHAFLAWVDGRELYVTVEDVTSRG